MMYFFNEDFNHSIIYYVKISSVVLFWTLSSILLQAISNHDVKNENQFPVYNVPTFFLINFLLFYMGNL